MVSTLITLLILVVVVVLAFWIVDKVGLPNPINWIAKGIIAIIALIALFQQLNINI